MTPGAQTFERYLAAQTERELLRVITCGTVDDGKSTLIGRLLYDSGQLHDDQLAALSRDSNRWGTTGAEPDLALLLDGLEAEREQGITIDIAHRYFDTPRRKFVLIDAPGHDEYTRNAATGLSTSDLAVVLVDARKGVRQQTRRHVRLAVLLGIRQLVFAVNKMDAVGFDRAVFERIAAEAQALLSATPEVAAHAIPVSALRGDNVVRRSQSMSWYQGASLLEHLETVEVPAAAHGSRALRLPIQLVLRPDADFRGYAGTIAAGCLRSGDEIIVLPSGQRSRVKTLSGSSGPRATAVAGEWVTLTLTDPIDVTRGDLLVHAKAAPPAISDSFEAHVVWMHPTPLVAGDRFDLKFGHRYVAASIAAIEERLDLGAQLGVAADRLAINDIGICRVVASVRIPIDPYAQCRETGSFIVVDRLTHATVGAGTVIRVLGDATASQLAEVHPSLPAVPPAERARQKLQRPSVIWLTGLSGAGKSTIANALDQALFARGRHSYIIDGDNLRGGLNQGLDFSEAGRAENIRRAAHVARMMADAGLIVIVALISPRAADREQARGIIGAADFIEVFVDAPLEVCRARDTKGLYARAQHGRVANFTGVSAAYEPPASPAVRVETASSSAGDAVTAILNHLGDREQAAPTRT